METSWGFAAETSAGRAATGPLVVSFKVGATAPPATNSPPEVAIAGAPGHEGSQHNMRLIGMIEIQLCKI